MNPVTISCAEIAPENMVSPPERGISSPLSAIACLSVGAVLLSLVIAAAFSLIVWSAAGYAPA